MHAATISATTIVFTYSIASTITAVVTAVCSTAGNIAVLLLHCCYRYYYVSVTGLTGAAAAAITATAAAIGCSCYS